MCNDKQSLGLLILVVDVPAQLPHLDAVVLLHTRQQQLLVRVPVQVHHLRPVPHVPVEVVCIMLLFLLGDVPDVHVSSVTAGGKHTGIEGTPLHLNHAVLLPVEGYQRSRQVSHVPHRDVFVSGPTHEEEFVEGREVQGVDLVRVPHHLEQRLLVLVGRGTSEPHVPNIDEPIVRAAGEDIGMETMPGHVLNGGIVMQNLEDREDLLVHLLVLLDIPDADTLITEPRNQQIFIYTVPTESVPLGRVSHQLAHRFLHGGERDISLIGGDGRQPRVSLAVPSPEYLSIVLYLLHHCDLMRLVLEVQLGYLRQKVHLFSLGQSILTFCSWHWSASAALEAMMAQQEVKSSPTQNSGSHWKVKVGQSTECKRRKSQQQGASFFQILYYWLIIIYSYSLNSESCTIYLPPLRTTNIIISKREGNHLSLAFINNTNFLQIIETE